MNKRRIYTLIDDLGIYEHEDVMIESHDGLNLHARYYHIRNDAPVIILFHGYRSAAERDFCGVFRVFRDLGHNILLVDERAHGQSDGSVITFGIMERYDCLCWINYAVQRFGDRCHVFIVGMSMGAATVLMASELDLPKNVVGIIADSPYSTPIDIIMKVARDRKYPPKIIKPFLGISSKLFGGFSVSESSAITAVKKCNVPILIIHGEGDTFVPSVMSCEIFDSATCTKRLVILPNNGHCVSYIFNTERYIYEIKKFVNENLKKDGQ